MTEVKRAFNDVIEDGCLDELLETTRKICNHKLRTNNVKLPTYVGEEDVVQDAMIKVFRAYKRFDPTKASANTYFTRIIDNTIVDHVRHSQVQNSVQDISSSSDSYGANIIKLVTGSGKFLDDSGENDLPRGIKDMAVRDRIQSSSKEEQLFTELMLDLKEMLTERELKIFNLRYAGYTHEEIAKKIGVSRPTVAKDWLRVRKIVLELIY